MSNIPLSNIQSIIERSLFESIRLELVDKEYLPDITNYTNDNMGQIGYESAISSIVNNKGFAIEVISEGSSHTKGLKKPPRIVLNTGSFLPGSLGGDPMRYFEDGGQYYTAKVTPPQTVDFYIDIRLVSDNVNQERVLNSILALAIPRRGYIKYYNDSGKSFFVKYLNYYDGDNQDQGIIEKIYSYEIVDVWDSEDMVSNNLVAKMTEITLHPNIQKYMDGSWGYNTGSIVMKYSPTGNIVSTSVLSGILKQS